MRQLETSPAGRVARPLTRATPGREGRVRCIAKLVSQRSMEVDHTVRSLDARGWRLHFIKCSRTSRADERVFLGVGRCVAATSKRSIVLQYFEEGEGKEARCGASRN